MAGYDTPEHVEQATAYENASAEEKDYASLLASPPCHTFGQGECTYCGHCKPCPVKIDIAMVNKYYDLAVMQPDVPAAVKERYLALKYRAACTFDFLARKERFDDMEITSYKSIFSK